MSDRNDNCRYCGDNGRGRHGYGCPYSPNGMHVEIGDDEHCIYCGSTSYGSNCTYSNVKGKLGKVHVHGHSRGRSGSPKCIYCGGTAKGNNCPYSPSGKHEF